MSERITEANRKLSKYPNRHARCKFTYWSKTVSHWEEIGRLAAVGCLYATPCSAVYYKGVRNKYIKEIEMEVLSNEETGNDAA